MFRDCLKGGVSHSGLAIATFVLATLYIMTSRTSLRLSSRLRQFMRYSMSPTLNVFRCLLMTTIAALC